MIEPTTAWWILVVFFIVNGVLLLKQFVDEDKDLVTIVTGIVMYTFIFYSLYVIKGVLQ